MSSGSIRTNGTQLFYREEGSGAPLVFLHGGLLDSRMLDDQVARFRRAFRTISYDLRGYGQSEWTPGVFSHHGDLQGLLHALDAEPAFLVGHSLGARTAVNCALEYPQAVRALVLVGPGLAGYPFSEDVERATSEIMGALHIGEPGQAAEIFIRLWVAGPRRSIEKVAADVVERVRIMIFDNFAQPPPGEMRFEEPDAIDRLGEIHVPTLMICGEEDIPDILAIADLLTTRIAGSRSVLLPQTAHMLNMELPEPFNRLLLEFLRTSE